jgi:hypothetical protein
MLLDGNGREREREVQRGFSILTFGLGVWKSFLKAPSVIVICKMTYKKWILVDLVDFKNFRLDNVIMNTIQTVMPKNIREFKLLV